MKQQTKLVILLVLMGVLGLAAFWVFVLGGGKKGITEDAVADGAADAAAVAVLPEVDELNKLKDWFVESPHKELVAQCPAQHLFGDAWVGELAAMTVAARRQAILAQATASATSPPDENEDDAIVAPPALEMLISADGVCKAVFGGESYGQGEYVGGSTFKVVDVTKDAVTLRSGKDRTVTLNLWN
jgi:hypothetical protein